MIYGKSFFVVVTVFALTLCGGSSVNCDAMYCDRDSLSCHVVSYRLKIVEGIKIEKQEVLRSLCFINDKAAGSISYEKYNNAEFFDSLIVKLRKEFPMSSSINIFKEIFDDSMSKERTKVAVCMLVESLLQNVLDMRSVAMSMKKRASLLQTKKNNK